MSNHCTTDTSEAYLARSYSTSLPNEVVHCMLGHASHARIAMMHRHDTGKMYNPRDLARWCLYCTLAKATDGGYRKESYRKALRLMQYASADVSTDMGTSVNGFKHFLCIVEWFSRMHWVYLLRTKAEAHEFLLWWLKWPRITLAERSAASSWTMVSVIPPESSSIANPLVPWST